MTLLDDSGVPLTLDSLMAEDPAPQGDPFPADAAPSPDGAGELLTAADVADAPDESVESQDPTASEIDWDDPSNPYLSRAHDAQERLHQFELSQRQQQAQARANMAQQIQAMRANRRVPLLQNLDQMNADQLRAVISREFQISDAEFGEVAGQVQRTQQQREWDDAVQRTVTDFGLTPDETELIAVAANEGAAREAAQKLVTRRTSTNAQMTLLQRQVAQLRKEQKVMAGQQTGTGPAQRVGGTSVGPAPSATPTSVLEIMRQELTGDPNTPVRAW